MERWEKFYLLFLRVMLELMLGFINIACIFSAVYSDWPWKILYGVFSIVLFTIMGMWWHITSD